MEIQQFRHLLAAASASNYAQAARKCFTSRQNVAHSIKALESELNVTLFEREGNEMVLTPAGEHVVHQANEIIMRVDGLRSAFGDSDVFVLWLDLAVSTNLFAGIPSSADVLSEDYIGGIRVSELGCEDCYEYVCNEKVDAALVMCLERKFPNCKALEIASSVSYALVSASSPLAKMEELSIMELKDQRLLLMSEPDFQYEPLFTQLDSLGFDRADVNVISSTSSMIHLVKRSSHVVSIVSKRFAADPPSGTVAIPISDPHLNWHFYMLYQMHKSSYHSIMKLAHDLRMAFDNDGECGSINQSF